MTAFDALSPGRITTCRVEHVGRKSAIVHPEGRQGRTDSAGDTIRTSNVTGRASRNFRTARWRRTSNSTTDDTILRSSAEGIYVFGQVKTPGAYALVQTIDGVLAGAVACWWRLPRMER